ncbi:MAG: preprotein translocase subunit SecE [Clostridia bacterium]|nr:preprotein translocase subunit SecE [Clostridia bacterium]MBQ5905618.1 preprotein translocase subunit SecE [Clostridia bacterium]
MADKEKKSVQDSKVEKATTDEAKAAQKVAKAAKGAGKKDKPNFFARAGKGSKKFIKDFKGECKKIVWPDAQTVLKSTGIVILVVAIVTIIVLGIDSALSAGVKGLKNLATGETETTTSAVADEHDHDHDHEGEEDEKEAEETTAAKAEEKETEAEETTAAEKTE